MVLVRGYVEIGTVFFFGESPFPPPTPPPLTNTPPHHHQPCNHLCYHPPHPPPAPPPPPPVMSHLHLLVNQRPSHTSGQMVINNGAIFTISQIIKAVMSSAAEAEIRALYINCREADPAQHTLEYLGHK